MRYKLKQSALTLTEMVVVIAVVALLTAFSLPAIKALHRSFASAGSTQTVIAAALSTARAIAAKEHRYAGIRFQQDLQGNQYIIYIIHDPQATGLMLGFRAVEGYKPVKLPDNIGVMDLMVRTNPDTRYAGDIPILTEHLDDSAPANRINSNLGGLDGKNLRIMDTTSFSIIFSPSGKMLIQEVRTSNRDAARNPTDLVQSADDIFNSPINIEGRNVEGIRIGLFVQDDYAQFGLGQEYSRNNFVIYEKDKFNSKNAAERYDYLMNLLKPVYINPYTGSMISQ